MEMVKAPEVQLPLGAVTLEARPACKHGKGVG